MKNPFIAFRFGGVAIAVAVLCSIAFGCQSAPQTPASQTSPPTASPQADTAAPPLPTSEPSPPSTPAAVPASPLPPQEVESEPEAESELELEEPEESELELESESESEELLEPQPIADDPEICSIIQARVEDPDPPTNLRSSPDASADNIAARVDNGLLLSVRGEKGEWLQVDFPNTSVEEEEAVWVSKSVVAYGCNQKVQAIRFAEGASGAIASDRFIGGGSHQYLLEASAGQTMTIEATEGPLPFVFAPNDPNRRQELTGAGGKSGESATIQLPADGEYVLELISNRKGYAYEFVVEVD